METIERTFEDKSSWPNGPWINEPDKIQFEDDATKLPCLIVRGPSGALCGYVGVAEGHPFFELDYNQEPLYGIDVHGGLTFSSFCREGAEETGICHVPAPGEPDRVWWLGFDCAHYMDLAPKYGSFGGNDVYRDVEYVKSECANLARQLLAAA